MVERNSEFFEAALRKEWKEGLEKTIELPEDDAKVFNKYHGWLYTRRLATPEGGYAGLDQSFTMLAKLYVLGEKLLDRDFQNSVSDALVSATRDERGPRGHGSGYKGRSFPGPKIIRIVYEGTTTGSPMRRLLTDFYVRHGAGQWIREDGVDKWPQEFLYDLSAALFDKWAITAETKEGLNELEEGPANSYHHRTRDEEKDGEEFTGLDLLFGS